MDYTSALLILLSVVLSSTRNLLSKGVSSFHFGTKIFFLSQLSLFFAGSIAVYLFERITLSSISITTALLAVVYGVLLILAQWGYTAALSSGKIAICSTIYSLGFIFPTLSGVFFWKEIIKPINIVGLLCVIPAVIISGLKTTETKNNTSDNNYIIPLIISMLSAGGLGIMQKVQQNSAYAYQRPEFVFMGFCVASVISFIGFIFAKSTANRVWDKKLFLSGGAGVCFGGCNLLNTTLAGRLDSAVFFPVYNISVILLSIILSYMIFREKLTKKEVAVFLLGIISIMLLNL